MAPGATERLTASRLGPPGRFVDLLHVGSTIPRKRIDLLLEVFAAVAARRPEVRLVRVGGRLDLHQIAPVRRQATFPRRADRGPGGGAGGVAVVDHHGQPAGDLGRWPVAPVGPLPAGQLRLLGRHHRGDRPRGPVSGPGHAGFTYSAGRGGTHKDI